MTIKLTWDEFLDKDNNIETIINSDVLSLGTQLDSAFNTKYGTSTKVSTALTLIKADYLLNSSAEGSNAIWKELPIWLSSYRENDKRPALKIQDNLIRYLRFLIKMTSDEGIQRRMVVARNFANNNSSSNTDKNIYSETPQLSLQTFEDAIAYASNVSRNENSASSSQSGASGETATNVNWEEALKNLQFAFYNEIVDYIISIPSELYNYYSLDSRPITELVKARKEALYNLFDL